MAVALAVSSYCNYTRGIGDEFGGGGGGGGKLLQSFEFSGGMQLAKEAKHCCRSRRDCDFREKTDIPEQLDTCSDQRKTKDLFPKLLKPQKRKLEGEEVCERMVKRVSPFLNTPKQRKEERKKIWRVTLKKLRLIDDPEQCLFRSVLINNTMKRLQEEIQEEKMSKFPSYCSRNSFFSDRHSPDSRIYNDAPIHSNLLHFDDPFTVDSMPPEKITDDMTEELMNSLEESSPPVTESSTRHHKMEYSSDNSLDLDIAINSTPSRSAGET